MGLVKILIFIFFIPIMLCAQTEQKKAYSHDDISALIKKVSLGNKKSLHDLMAVSLQDHPITLTQDIVKVVIFGLIRSNENAKLKSYLKKVDPGLTSFLNEKKLNQGCNKCEGEGHTNAKCPKCVFGKCYNCKGKGFIEYKGLKGFGKKGEEADKGKEKEKSICNTCHSTGKCLKCKGEGTLEQDCSHCSQGSVLNKNSIQKEMIKSLQRISEETNSKVSVKTVSEVKNNEDLDSLYNLSVKKSVDQTETGKMASIEDSGIQEAFKKAKSYIEGYELKNNKEICKEISLNYIDKVPTLVLDLTDEYMQKIGSTEIREVSGFKKYWEDQAVIHNYANEVLTILMNKGLKVNDKFKLVEKYKRIK